MKKVSSTSGFVDIVDNLYVFRARNGKVYGIAQDELAKRLYNSHQICVLDVIDTKDKRCTFGTIREVVGKSGDPIPEGKAIASSHNLIHPVDSGVRDALKTIPKKVAFDDAKDYRDFRNIPFVTIDPDGAKDFDDAVYGELNPDGSYKLMVAIADVSHYLQKNSTLYNDAISKGNSTYLGDTVYPMLDEKLSNGICSLNEGVDRLTMCTTANIAPDGKLLNYTIEPAVIKSRNRLTYKEADFIYFGENADGDENDHSDILSKVDDEVTQSLCALYELSQILNANRMERGAISINSDELEFKLDDTKTSVEKISHAHSEKFTRVIEETAVLVNEIWGDIAERFGIPFIFRNLNPIDPTKVTQINEDLKQFQLKLPKKPTGKDIQTLLNAVKGKNIEDYVSRTIIRSFEHAHYSDKNTGHVALAVQPAKSFRSYVQKMEYDKLNEGGIESARDRYFQATGKTNGLSFEGDITHSAYGHTTSPIRRGSDTVNQIEMKTLLEKGNYAYKPYELERISTGLNMCEKNAQTAEREYDMMLSALWASKNIGHVFNECVIVDVGSTVTVQSSEGIKLLIDFSSIPGGRKYAKIGRVLKNVVIESASLYPPRIRGVVSGACNEQAQDDEQENVI